MPPAASGRGLAATLAQACVGVFARRFGLVMRRVVGDETVRNVCLYRPLARTLSPAAWGFAEHLAQWLARRPEGGDVRRERRAPRQR